MVFRKVKGVARVRYQESDLRRGYVASGLPISRYGESDFMTGDVCGDEGASSSTTSAPSTTVAPGG